MQRIVAALATLAGAALLGVALGDLWALVVASAAIITVVVVRVSATERQRATPAWTLLLAEFAVVLLGTRLVLWLGPIGGAIAIVVVLILLLNAGFDLG